MKFSSRAQYGLRAALVLAGSYRSGPVPLSGIAREEGISLAYLEQLAARLRRAGLFVSTRGARGGYTLAADPASITAGQVLRALDEDIAPAQCVAEARSSGGCGREDACSSRPLWQNVRDSVAGVLDSTTLADLCATPGATSREVPPVERKK